MRNRPPLTTQLAELATAPELTAAAASEPCFWKNRTRMARGPMGTARATKLFDTSSARTRP